LLNRFFMDNLLALSGKHALGKGRSVHDAAAAREGWRGQAVDSLS
jgi:hypothetical protein